MNELDEKVQKKNKKFDKLKNKNYSKEVENMKKAIDRLKKDMVNLDVKNAVIDNAVLHYYKEESQNSQQSLKQKGSFGVDDFVDEYL